MKKFCITINSHAYDPTRKERLHGWQTKSRLLTVLHRSWIHLVQVLPVKDKTDKYADKWDCLSSYKVNHILWCNLRDVFNTFLITLSITIVASPISVKNWSVSQPVEQRLYITTFHLKGKYYVMDWKYYVMDWKRIYIPTWGSPVFASIFPNKPLILAVSSSWWQLLCWQGFKGYRQVHSSVIYHIENRNTIKNLLYLIVYDLPVARKSCVVALYIQFEFSYRS